MYTLPIETREVVRNNPILLAGLINLVVVEKKDPAAVPVKVWEEILVALDNQMAATDITDLVHGLANMMDYDTAFAMMYVTRRIYEKHNYPLKSMSIPEMIDELNARTDADPLLVQMKRTLPRDKRENEVSMKRQFISLLN